MKANSSPDITAGAWAGANRRIQLRVGVFRFTCMPGEALDLAGQLIDAVVEQVDRASGNAIATHQFVAAVDEIERL